MAFLKGKHAHRCVWLAHYSQLLHFPLSSSNKNLFFYDELFHLAFFFPMFVNVSMEQIKGSYETYLVIDEEEETYFKIHQVLTFTRYMKR